MAIKHLLRRFGVDFVYYHPLYEHLLVEQKIGTVIDVGASDGQFTQGIRALLPEAYVYAFEPLRDVYEKLQRNLADDARFAAYNLGLGDAKGTMTINRSSFSPSSSLLPMADLHKKLFPKTAGTTQEDVRVERLDDIQDVEVHGNLLVKLDVQGYEDKVIRGAVRTISRASMLVIETSLVPLYTGQALFGDIVALLNPLGFAYRGTREQHWDARTHQLLYQDSIFTRSRG